MTTIDKQFEIKRIDFAKKNLIVHQPFWGIIACNLFSEYYNDTQVDFPFAAVASVTRTIYYNYTNLSDFSIPQIEEIIKHECAHIAQKHHIRFLRYTIPTDKKEAKTFHKLANYAMDCSINQFLDQEIIKQIDEIIKNTRIQKIQADIDKLQQIERTEEQEKSLQHLLKVIDKIKSGELLVGLISLQFISNLCQCNLNEKESFEYYFDALLKRKEQVEQEIQDKYGDLLDDIMNNHKELLDGNLDDYNSVFYENLIQKAIEKQTQHDISQGKEHNNEFIKLIPKTVRNYNKNVWKRLLNHCIGSTPCEENEYVYGRISRRNPNSMWYKRTLLRDNKVYIGIDTSGSMFSEDVLSSILGYINVCLKREDVTATLIQADTEISHVQHNLKSIPTRGYNLCGGGGTDLTCILKYISEKEGNANVNLFLLTDGYTNWDTQYSNIKTVCIYTPEHIKIPNTIDGGVFEI